MKDLLPWLSQVLPTNKDNTEKQTCPTVTVGHTYPGVAQLVARLTGGQEAAGSSPVTRTKNSKDVKFLEFLLITYYLFTLH